METILIREQLFSTNLLTTLRVQHRKCQLNHAFAFGEVNSQRSVLFSASFVNYTIPGQRLDD